MWPVATVRSAGWWRLPATIHSTSCGPRKPAGDDIEAAFDLADSGPNPEQATIQSSERAQIEGCLETLEPDKADCVRGAYLDGYSYDELATRHSVPLNTMRTWLRRSLLKLRDCLTA